MTDQIDRLTAALADLYAIQHELGAGGMATVYLAEDAKHHRSVAVKVLRPDIAQTLGAERFVREIEIAAQLQHPHILPLLDSGEADGFLFYVMPFVDGESLRARLDREHELPVQEAVKILHEVVDGLAKAHSRGVVHRDIKPDNILLSDGHAVIADFGVAKAVSEATGGGKMTTAGMALGTPAYMAPEQAVADPHVDHRADIYAVGVMAYEMLAGRPPFDGSTPQAILAAQVTQSPDPITTHRSAVPPVLSSLIMKCLEKKAADRWQSADELRAELEMLATPSGGTTSVSGPAPARNRAGLALTAAAVVILGIGAALWFGRGAPSTVVGSAERMAVIPFAPTVNDSALFRLGRDMVVLLSSNLDGVSDIAVVDASTVLSRVADDGQTLSLEQAAEAARGLGASSFVHGRFVRTGDDIILDVTLNEAGDQAELGRASVRAREDDIVALTDSITWALLASVWRGADAPTPSLGAVTTRSLPALRAFLDGERAIADGAWFEVPDHFRRAFEADTMFLMAYFRYWEGQNWLLRSVEPSVRDRLERDRGLLPERERLLVEARLAPNLEARLAIGRELTDRFPDYWPGWMEYGDRLAHYGGYLGYDISDARSVFERIVSLNPKFLPGWDHLAAIGLMTWDTELVNTALDSLRAKSAGDSRVYNDAFMAMFESQIEAQGGDFEITDEEADEAALGSIQFGRMMGVPGGYGFFGPTSESAVKTAERALALTTRPDELRVLRFHLARAVAATGAWARALSIADEAAAERSIGSRLSAYRLAALGVWLEALPAEVMTERSPGELMADPEVTPTLRGELVWWEGALGLATNDAQAVARARQRLADGEVARRAYLDSSLAAYELALEGDELRAARMLAGLEMNAEHATWSADVHYTAMVNRLAASEWFIANGFTDDAERILRHLNAQVPSAPHVAAMTQVAAITTLQRARAADAGNRRDEALHYYNRFLVAYINPDESHQPLRAEAQAAITRLTAERN